MSTGVDEKLTDCRMDEEHESLVKAERQKHFDCFLLFLIQSQKRSCKEFMENGKLQVNLKNMLPLVSKMSNHDILKLIPK